jgi:hypothetical protein
MMLSQSFTACYAIARCLYTPGGEVGLRDRYHPPGAPEAGVSAFPFSPLWAVQMTFH